MIDKVGQLVLVFSSLNKNDKICLLLYGFKPENSDYFVINSQITLIVQTYLMQTKRFCKSVL